MHKIGTSERPDLPLAAVVGAGALGMAVARRLALSNRVLLADIDGRAAEERAAQMRGEGCDATAIACDSTSPEACAALAARVAELGGLGVLAYVAGLSPSAADFRSIIRVNLMGAALVAEALLAQTRPGSVAILVSSLGALHVRPSPDVVAILHDASAADIAERLEAAMGADATPQLAYPFSKWGMNLYCRRQAVAWGERGARIVSLSPGLIATPMGALEFEKSPGKRALYEKTPLKRECTMLEIADALEFLASPRASFISGIDLRVDGGLGAAMGEE